MANFDNRISQIFHVENGKQYRVKLIYQDGRPLLGFSVFYQHLTAWYPGKKHFFMSVEAWKDLMLHMTSFNEKAMEGGLNT